MEIDQKTQLLLQISAAVATNSLAALRSAATDAKALGVPNDIIRQTIQVGLEVQQHSLSHTQHLTNQLMREPAKNSKKNGASHSHHGGGCGGGCGCGHHHQ